MKQDKHSEHIRTAISQLNDQSDRAAAIVAGSIVEIVLTETLKDILHKNEKVTSELFRISGPLGVFGSKIDIAFLVGLLSEETHREFVTFKDIRNAFAHSLEVSDFNSDKPRALAQNLKLFEKHTVDSNPETPDERAEKTWAIGMVDLKSRLSVPRERYLISAQVFTMGLSDARVTKMPKPSYRRILVTDGVRRQRFELAI